MTPESRSFLAERYGLVLLDPRQNTSDKFDLSLIHHGVATDFKPSADQAAWLRGLFPKIALQNTLFTVDQATNMALADKLRAQISEYWLSYGLGGAFVRSAEKQAVTLRQLRGVSGGALDTFLRKQASGALAMNSEDAGRLAALLQQRLPILDLSLINNNELRVALMARRHAASQPLGGVDEIGVDDLMRFIVHLHTGSTLLIKNNETIKAIREADIMPAWILFDHADVLAQGFHRYKPLLLALRKDAESRQAVNRIRRLAKRRHVPITMPASRTFLADFARDPSVMERLDSFTITDCFRILNAIVLGRGLMKTRAYVVRNGKIWYDDTPEGHPKHVLDAAQDVVLARIRALCAHLVGENIRLPENIRLGLPVSQKQSVGRLPFGSVINTGAGVGEHVSAGIYWENDWGARDLDLSSVDLSGMRTGWGDAASYTRESVQFSGDITNAPQGAMEFVTVTHSPGIALFVNIYAGVVGSNCKLVIGRRDAAKEQWIDPVMFEEMTVLESRNNLIGYLTPDNDYVVYRGGLGGAHVSSLKNRAVVEHGLAPFWTVDELFLFLDMEHDPDRPTTIDLSYESLTFETLASVFEPS